MNVKEVIVSVVTCSRVEDVLLHCVVHCTAKEVPGSKQVGPYVLSGISLLLWKDTPEQNTEQKFMLSFPYKSLALTCEARL